MDSEGIAFANEARIACSKAMVKWGTGQHDAAIEAISLLCDRAAAIVHGANMKNEQADLREDRFDLAALKVDMRSEAPERGDD